MSADTMPDLLHRIEVLAQAKADGWWREQVLKLRAERDTAWTFAWEQAVDVLRAKGFTAAAEYLANLDNPTYVEVVP